MPAASAAARSNARQKYSFPSVLNYIYNLKNHLQSCTANLSTFGRKTIAIHNKPVKGPGGCIGEIAKKEAIALLNTLRYEKEPIPAISA